MCLQTAVYLASFPTQSATLIFTVIQISSIEIIVDNCFMFLYSGFYFSSVVVCEYYYVHYTYICFHFNHRPQICHYYISDGSMWWRFLSFDFLIYINKLLFGEIYGVVEGYSFLNADDKTLPHSTDEYSKIVTNKCYVIVTFKHQNYNHDLSFRLVHDEIHYILHLANNCIF